MEFEDWVKDLQNGNRDYKLIAIEMLGLYGKPPAIEPLTTQLQSTDEEIRVLAVESLAMINDPRVVNLMIGALSDQSCMVRKSAVCALAGAIAACPETIPAETKHMLEKAMHDQDFDVRWRAAEALLCMGKAPTQ